MTSKDDTIRALVNDGADAKTIRAALGRGGTLAFSAAVKRLGLKPSKPGVQKGHHTYYDEDTTFTF